MINVSKSVEVNKTSASKECYICHYWYFLDNGFRFQSAVYNGWRDMLIMSIDPNSIAISNIHGVHYPGIFNGITKTEVIKLLKMLILVRKVEKFIIF